MLITCSNCQSKIRVPDTAAGKKGKCPKCGTVMVIPAAEEASAEESAAAAPGGSPFDFGGEEPPAPTKKRRPADEEEEAPPRRGKSAQASDEVEEEPAEPEGEEEEHGGRRKKRGGGQESIGLSVTSLVLGIVSVLSGVCCGIGCHVFSTPVTFLLALAALILGYIGMKKGGKVMAIIGMSTGGLGMGICLVWLILGIILIASGGFAARWEQMMQQIQMQQQMQQKGQFPQKGNVNK